MCEKQNINSSDLRRHRGGDFCADNIHCDKKPRGYQIIDFDQK